MKISRCFCVCVCMCVSTKKWPEWWWVLVYSAASMIANRVKQMQTILWSMCGSNATSLFDIERQMHVCPEVKWFFCTFFFCYSFRVWNFGTSKIIIIANDLSKSRCGLFVACFSPPCTGSCTNHKWMLQKMNTDMRSSKRNSTLKCISSGEFQFTNKHLTGHFASELECLTIY